MSRIGNKPIAIPDGVKLEIKDKELSVNGPKGSLSYKLPASINCRLDNKQIIFERDTDNKTDKALHGLSRALVFNLIQGVNVGFSKELEIIGSGFRAQVQGKNLVMQLGFSHPVNFPIPEDIKIQAPKPNQLVVSGIDKQRVGKIASEIRAILPPEPYKGKGIRYKGEYVRKKLGKTATK